MLVLRLLVFFQKVTFAFHYVTNNKLNRGYETQSALAAEAVHAIRHAALMLAGIKITFFVN